MISGSEHEHRDHRISSVRNDVDRQPTMYGRIGSKCLSILSSKLRQHLSNMKKEKRNGETELKFDPKETKKENSASILFFRTE